MAESKSGAGGAGHWHSVRAGDSVPSLAQEQGVFWKDLWSHPQNRNLRKVREDPNLLHEGDSIFIPDREPGDVSAAAESRHRYRLKGVPSILRIRLMRPPRTERDLLGRLVEASGGSEPATDDTNADREEPWAGVFFTLDIDGKLHTDVADDRGMIEVSIPPRARRGKIQVAPGTDVAMEMELELSHLRPVNTFLGVTDRLRNLGFLADRCEGPESPAYAAALLRFQLAHGLPETGEADNQTHAKIVELHGS